MEAILHIEPIMRSHKAPLSIGHTEYIFYGNGESDDVEDPVGGESSFIRLGYPLEDIDYGSTRSHVPLVKTIEYAPDLSKNSGNVYTETIHYLKDRKFLIPVRTKVHSGISSGLRISHLPSLNLARKELSGMDWTACDMRAELVTGLLNEDVYFTKNTNHPVMSFIRDELINRLDSNTLTDISFDHIQIEDVIRRYRDQVIRTPHELNSGHLRELVRVLGMTHDAVPLSYQSNNAITVPIFNVRDRLVNHDVNLRSSGRIPVENLPGIEYNPLAFQGILEVIDKLPLTDLNIDVILDIDNRITFRHVHVVSNRLATFEDNELGAFSSESLMYDIINEEILHGILEKFIRHHPAVNDDIRELITHEPVKIKIIKTILDEALILLYRYNSGPNDQPLCGVYFDIALQSLAPMSIIPAPI